MLDSPAGDASQLQDANPSSEAVEGSADPALGRIVALAADLLDVSAALLSILDHEGARVGAQVGLERHLPVGARLPRSWPLRDGPHRDAGSRIVFDAAADLDLYDDLFVSGPPQIRFLAGVPLWSPEGVVLGTLFVMDDTVRPHPTPSDMRRLASLAALAVDALQRRLGERAALADAEALAAAKSDLLADVSHEMRTPLNGIVGFTGLLKRDGDLTPEEMRTVERIEEAGRGLLGIVEDALDLSKIGSGAAPLDARPFSVLRLVEDAVALVRPDADRKGLGLAVDPPVAPVGPLLGDPGRLRQVVLNLLANAVKFTGAGAIRVSVVCQDVGPDAPVPLSITVGDTGVGLDSDSIPRLFQRFAQADGTVSRRFGGTGLGLAISKTLVEAMGGTITVDSTPGIGSLFSVSLVLPRAPDARPLRPASRKRGARADLKGLAILLAEDAPLNQKLVVQMLSPLGADVDVVDDGAAAVEAVGRRDYAVVLMDMEMPVLGGLDATRRIRALAGPAAHRPIVALTANVFPEQLDLCRDAGMNDHLTKPFSADDLAAMVLRWGRRVASDEG